MDNTKILIKKAKEHPKEEGSGTIKINTSTTIETLEEAVELLEDKFPNRLPTAKLPIEDIYRLIGRQDVITYLTNLINKEREGL